MVTPTILKMEQTQQMIDTIQNFVQTDQVGLVYLELYPD